MCSILSFQLLKRSVYHVRKAPYLPAKQNVLGEDELHFDTQITCTSGSDVDSFSPVDLEGDGDIDIVYGIRDLGQLIWFRQEGYLNFIEDTISLEAKNINFLEVRDVDGDSDMDILATLATPTNQVVWFRQIGINTAEFEKHIIDLNINNPSSLTLTNLDQDNHIDIIATAFNSGKIVWYEYQNNQFSKKILNPEIVRGFEHIQAHDIDQDDLQDLVAVSLINNSLIWYKNDGQGGFIPKTIDNNLTKPTSVQIQDLNADQMADIVITDEKGCFWYKAQRNEGVLSFVKQESLDVTLSKVSFVQIVDLNEDGHLDLVVGSREGEEALWYQNVPVLPDEIDFVRQSLSDPVPNLPGIESIYVIDLDNDGDLDILSSSIDGGGVAWMINSESTIFNISGNHNICYDEIYTYRVPLTPGMEYSWRIEGGEIVDENNNVIQVQWSTAETKGELILETKTNCLPPHNQTFEVNIHLFPQPNIREETIACKGIKKKYSSLLTGSNNQIHWQIKGGKILSQTSINDLSEVEVVWEDIGEAELIIYEEAEQACFNYDTLRVTVYPTLENLELVTENNQNFICFGQNQSLVLEAKTNIPADNYEWYCDNVLIPNANTSRYRAVREGNYRVKAKSSCSIQREFEAEQYIDVINLEAPNVVTPNGDGRNDRFIVYYTDIQDIVSIQITIIDRLGNVVYQTNNKREVTEIGWDGGKHPSGQYYCILQATLRNCGADQDRFDIYLSR